MKKKILAISILTAIMSGNVFAISNEDLLDIDNLFNKDKKEKEVKENNIKNNKVESKEINKVEKKSLVIEDSKTKKETVIEKVKEENSVIEQPLKPLIPVPITGDNINFKISLLKSKLIKEKISNTEVILFNLNPIEEKFKNEPEVLETLKNKKSSDSFSNYTVDTDVLVGMDRKVVEGQLVEIPIFKNVKTGQTLFIELVQFDKERNRAKVKLSINIADAAYYNEFKYQMKDGTNQKIKIPHIVESNNSKEFWINLDSGSVFEYKVDDFHLVKIEIQRVIPFIQQVFVVDHEKIKRMEEEKKQQEIQKIEDEKLKKINEENDLFDSLEKNLKK